MPKHRGFHSTYRSLATAMTRALVIIGLILLFGLALDSDPPAKKERKPQIVIVPIVRDQELFYD